MGDLGAQGSNGRLVDHVANLLAFHTLVNITQALQQIQQVGHSIDLAALATFSPYSTEHCNRFGDYALNPNRRPDPLEQYLAFPIPGLPE